MPAIPPMPAIDASATLHMAAAVSAPVPRQTPPHSSVHLLSEPDIRHVRESARRLLIVDENWW